MGAGPGKVSLYKGREPVIKNLPLEKAVDALEDLINQDFSSRETGNIS
jgi:(E)-4-hydroxy-3-methylbut-2-enyl-diphosphate synthase